MPAPATTEPRRFYVVFCPNTKGDDLQVRSFPTRSDANDFRDIVDNYTEGVSIGGGVADATYCRCVKEYKGVYAEQGQEYAESIGYGYIGQ